MGMASTVAAGERQRLVRMAREVLLATDRAYGEHRVFLPDGRKYPFQCYWDSAFQALVAARFWPERAEREFFSLYSKQYEDGRVPHLVCWEKPGPAWRFICYRGGWVGPDGRAILSTQPSAGPFCALEVYRRTGNRAFLEKVLPFLTAEMEYAQYSRDLLGHGLTAIINCMESGTDESPVYDEVMDVRGERPLGLLLYGVELAREIREYRRVGNDLERITDLGLFVVEDLCNNSLLCLSLRAVGEIYGELGNEGRAGEFKERAAAVASRMEELCWDEDAGIFLSRYLKDGEVRKSHTGTLSSVLPLFTGLISSDKAARLVKEHVLNDDRFWTTSPLSFVTADDPRERPGWKPWSLPMLWRGGTWVNMNWMVAVGLLEYGYREEAAELTRRTAEMVLREGYREFFNSRTGRGYGGKAYGWSTLVVDMVDRCR
ncbi:MAG: hypothetical protein KKB90_04665 [Actinobacteria bacterium]|nr:hypothetical protein [Actinomycetota bacterium]MCG2818573.1 hypothetical protein [Actinomycetes bacterium]MBU4178766.1 hypothetical protein [Actinomycetota bacterium]MBU4218238.1 hypothetical protein [Actinomycetota bacterium]MBU4358663.1 hypothetical protein [Actinomycetota bacterium]